LQKPGAALGQWRANPTGLFLHQVLDAALPLSSAASRRRSMSIERAELGIDGNCGFALLGEDLQAGEAEFVEVIPTKAGLYWDQRGAAHEALRRLRVRLNKPDLSYFLGESHPSHC
jgi:hypothetical protein